MSLKNVVHKIGRGVTKFILLSSILLGSCSGLSVAHNKSAFWSLGEIDDEQARSTNKFFVAFVEKTSAAKQSVFALPYRTILESPGNSKRSFRLVDGKTTIDEPVGEGRITIWSETTENNIQNTTVHAVGDTPWVSVSEYQVEGERIIPRRFGSAVSSLLLAALILPIVLVFLLQKPVRRIAEKIFPIIEAAEVQ